MRKLFIALLLICGVAQAQFVYHEEFATGGGEADADGGIDFEANGDMEISGEIIGKNSDELVLSADDADDSIKLGGTGVGQATALYPTTSDDTVLGLPAARFDAYLGFLDVAGLVSFGASTTFSDSFLLYDIDTLGSTHDFDHKVNLDVSPVTTTKTVSRIEFIDDNNGGDGLTAEGEIHFFAAPTSSALPATAQLVISGEDNITANVVINAEGGIAVGGTVVIPAASAEKIVFEDANAVLEAGFTIDASAAGSNFTDASISDSLTIDSGGDLSAPPVIGGTTANEASFTSMSATYAEFSDLSGAFFNVTNKQLDVGMFSYDNEILYDFNRANGSIGSETIVASGDDITILSFKGYDGTDYETAAYILAEIETTPGANDMPGSLKIYITPDGSATGTLQMDIQEDRVTTNHNQYIGTDELDATILRIEGQRASTSPISIQNLAYGETASVRDGVTNGQVLYRNQFWGSYDGSATDKGAEIQVIVDAAPGANDMPLRIEFHTSPDGTDVPVKALTIDSSQDITFENQLIAGTTTIVNSSEEVLSDALEATNALASDTWVAYSEDNDKGQSVDVIEATGSQINVSGANQTIVIDSFYHTINPAAGTDDIDTINGSSFTGQELIIVNSSANTVTFNDGLGNIDTLDDTDTGIQSLGWIKFFYDGTNWREINHKV